MLLSVLLLSALVVVADSEFRTQDIGDTFEKAGAIAEYADEKLAAAARGEPLPDPPVILADLTTLNLGLLTTIGYQVALVVLVIAIMRRPGRELYHGLQLNHYDIGGIWRPGVTAFGCYLLVLVYAVVVSALGIGPLEPESTVPFEVTRSELTIALTGVTAVIGAPISEELLFRGLIFGGLSRWGFWPAAVLSGLLFSGVHLDLGSLVPFFIIGVALAWLFWRRGNLLDAIAFHVLFNAASFALLLATEL